jgi:hypothetical protein
MKTIFTFFVLMYCSASFAQFINNQQQQSVYYSRQNSYGNESNLRYAAEEISNNNRNNSPSLGYNYTEKIRVYQSGQDAVEARFMIDNIQVQNIQYKGFDFTELFMPTAVEVQGELWRNGRRLQTYNSQQQYVNGRQAGEFIMRYQDTMQSTNYEFRLSRVSLEFNSNMHDRVKKRAEAAEEYSVSSVKNQGWNNQLYSINTQNADVDSLDAYEERLKRVEKEFNEWRNARFWDELDVTQTRNNDPMQVEELRNNTQRQINDKKEAFERLDIPYLYAQKSNEWFNRQNYTKSESYANKALYKKTNYSLGKLMRAKIYAVEEKWDDAIDYYQDACDSKRDMDDKPNWQIELSNTGERILNYYQQNAQSALNAKEWERAAKNGKQWRIVCDKNQDCINCNLGNINAFFEQLSQRWQQHYQQLSQQNCQKVSNYIQSKNWQEANQSLQRAKTDLKVCEDISDDYGYKLNIEAEKENVVRLHYKLYYDWANFEYNNENLAAALDKIQVAKTVANKYGFLSDKNKEVEGLEFKIQKGSFEQKIKLANQKTSNNNFEEALILSSAAQKLDNNYNFLSSGEKTKLAENIQNLGTKSIAQQVDNGLNTAQDEMVLLALWQKLQQQQVEYKLISPEVGNNLERLRADVCQKVQSQRLDKNINYMREAMAGKNFIKAKVFLDSIKKYSSNFSPLNCNFDNQFVASVIDEIESCERYQQTQQLAADLERQGFYDVAVPKYAEANEIYKNAWVQKNFVNAQFNLVDYIISKNDKGFIMSACRYYQNQQDGDNALSLLLVWMKLENPKERRITNNSQKVVAQLLAKKYYSKDKKWQQGLKEVLKENSSSKEWKVFKKSFKRAWRANTNLKK